jgi:hypothetical protein
MVSRETVMKLKRCLLKPTMVAALIALCACSEPQINTPATVEVVLVGSQATTVAGRYLLCFDTGVGQYVTLKREARSLLLTDWNARAPERLKVSGGIARLRTIEHLEIIADKTVITQVYELDVALTIATVPDAAALRSTCDVVASFPTALVVARRLNASAPANVPEIRFHVLHYPSNSSRAFHRIGKDAGLLLMFAVVSIIGWWLVVLYGSFLDSSGLGYFGGCGFVLLPGFALVSVGLFGIGATLYYVFLVLRDLGWIISKLWGG